MNDGAGWPQREQDVALVDDVVAEQHGERLVADVLASETHRVPEPQLLGLTHIVDVRERVERLPVALQCRFRIRAAGQMVPQVLRQIAPRGTHDLLQRHKIRCRRAARAPLHGMHARMRIAR